MRVERRLCVSLNVYIERAPLSRDPDRRRRVDRARGKVHADDVRRVGLWREDQPRIACLEVVAEADRAVRPSGGAGEVHQPPARVESRRAMVVADQILRIVGPRDGQDANDRSRRTNHQHRERRRTDEQRGIAAIADQRSRLPSICIGRRRSRVGDQEPMRERRVEQQHAARGHVVDVHASVAKRDGRGDAAQRIHRYPLDLPEGTNRRWLLRAGARARQRSDDRSTRHNCTHGYATSPVTGHRRPGRRLARRAFRQAAETRGSTDPTCPHERPPDTGDRDTPS